MTPEQYTTLAAEIPYRPRTENATGLLAPLVRSMGHILFLLGCTAAETDRSETAVPLLTPEEKRNELTNATDHLPSLDTTEASEVLSTAAKAHILTYTSLLDFLATEWSQWTPEDQLATLRATANAAAALATFLDQELAGFTPDQSNPGTSL
jgi:hypothetical protein